MEEWQQSVRAWIDGRELVQATLSGLRRKGADAPSRTVVRPIRLKNGLFYQFEYHTANKATHENIAPEAAAERLIGLLDDTYRQALLKTAEADVQLLFNKKGRAAMLRKPPTAAPGSGDSLSHNRVKKRVIAEGEAAAFLVELGIMTRDGKVRARMQDKFRQINRFLEMVSDVLDALPRGKELTIVDFGCGKSYLTFALYHLLVERHRLPVRITGLDLKEDVIAFCSDLANKLGYDRLRFLHGDIAAYEGLQSADMVITLHACDTATDAALAKAVRWGASVILSVPCCQHELFGQVASDELAPLLAHGLFKERFASLATDAVRAALLQSLGYKVQILEFIDMEHTLKNVLIRAVKGEKDGRNERKWEEYIKFRDFLSLSPYLERELSGIVSVES